MINQPGEAAVADPALRESVLTGKRARLKSLPVTVYPQLAESADYFLELPDEDDYYERGLVLLLNGVRLSRCDGRPLTFPRRLPIIMFVDGRGTEPG